MPHLLATRKSFTDYLEQDREVEKKNMKLSNKKKRIE